MKQNRTQRIRQAAALIEDGADFDQLRHAMRLPPSVLRRTLQSRRLLMRLKAGMAIDELRERAGAPFPPLGLYALVRMCLRCPRGPYCRGWKDAVDVCQATLSSTNRHELTPLRKLAQGVPLSQLVQATGIDGAVTGNSSSPLNDIDLLPPKTV